MFKHLLRRSRLGDIQVPSQTQALVASNFGMQTVEIKFKSEMLNTELS